MWMGFNLMPSMTILIIFVRSLDLAIYIQWHRGIQMNTKCLLQPDSWIFIRIWWICEVAVRCEGPSLQWVMELKWQVSIIASCPRTLFIRISWKLQFQFYFQCDKPCIAIASSQWESTQLGSLLGLQQLQSCIKTELQRCVVSRGIIVGKAWSELHKLVNGFTKCCCCNNAESFCWRCDAEILIWRLIVLHLGRDTGCLLQELSLGMDSIFRWNQ